MQQSPLKVHNAFGRLVFLKGNISYMHGTGGPGIDCILAAEGIMADLATEEHEQP